MPYRCKLSLLSLLLVSAFCAALPSALRAQSDSEPELLEFPADSAPSASTWAPPTASDSPADGRPSALGLHQGQRNSDPRNLRLDRDDRKSYGVAIFFSYLLPIPMVPIVHGMHGNIGLGLLGLAGIYGSMLGGAYLGSLTCSNTNESHFGCFGPVMAGMMLGWLAWALFDATVLAYERPIAKPAPAPSKPQLSLAAPDHGLGMVAIVRRRF